MLNNGIIEAANKQSGFSLIELMVAVVLGLLITAAVTAMTVNNLKMSGNTLKSARLNQDLGAVMQIMVNDIRRAGYSYCEKANYECPEDENELEQSFITYAAGEDIHIGDADGDDPPDDGDCILYRYNRDSNADKTDDNFGFRRIENDDNIGILQMADNTGAIACDADDNWVSLTDPDIIAITAFEIDSGNSKCHNIDEVVSVRIAPGVSAMEFACNEPDEDNLQEGVVDDDGDWSWGTLTIEMDESDSLKKYGSADPIYSVGVRHVNILLRGVFNDPFVEAGSDYNEYPIKKSLDVSIKVRNDHVYKYEP